MGACMMQAGQGREGRGGRVGEEAAYLVAGDDLVQGARLDVAHLDELGIEGEDVGVVQGEGGGRAFPAEEPRGPGAPAILVDVEGELVVAQEELAIDAEDGDRLEVFLALHELERRVGGVQEALGIEGFEVDDLESLDGADAQLGLEEVDRAGLGGDVEFLEHAQRVLAAGQHLAERRVLFGTGVHVDGLERLDGRGGRAGLDDTHERAPEAHACAEEGRVARDAAAVAHRGAGIARIERIERECVHDMLGKHEEDLELLEHVHLQDMAQGEHERRRAAAITQVLQVHAVGEAEEHLAPAIEGHRAGDDDGRAAGRHGDQVKDAALLAEAVLAAFNVLDPFVAAGEGAGPEREGVALLAEVRKGKRVA